MRTISLYKYQHTGDYDRAEDLEIHFNAEIPTPKHVKYPGNLKEHDQVAADQAETLEDELYHILPGGVYHLVAGLMLKRIGCQLVVPLYNPQMLEFERYWTMKGWIKAFKGWFKRPLKGKK